ncbi:hypothetical protein GCM10010306_014290 [Streptomyces umbrinus]|uniref:hypothetical protein n=1 Tax=Streptomyces umbrinus TaxID=67370 RepID=UPI001672F658|nr:hypothetical protein [Streptomyces umbrinus]GHB22686.1 hypothetical protein GCM10010306_014290 [Streptomyces umbrinus]
MTETANRALIASSITVNVVSLGTAIAAPLADLPEGVQAAAVGVAGVTSIGLIWKYVTVSRATLARNLLLASCALVTVLGILLTWPGGSPIKSTQNKQGTESDAKNDQTQGSKPASNETAVRKAAAQLKQGIKEPDRESDIPSCITATGDGRIPSGYGLWVANLPDSGGTADMTALSNMQRADQPDGETSWRTPEFGVGLDARDAGTDYWIYLFLLPESADSALTNLKPTKAGLSLTAPVKGATRVDKFRVTRTGTITCRYQKKP